MYKISSIAILVLFLYGCDTKINQNSISKAYDVCANNRGVKTIENSLNVTVVCNNGANFSWYQGVRISNKPSDEVVVYGKS